MVNIGRSLTFSWSYWSLGLSISRSLLPPHLDWSPGNAAVTPGRWRGWNSLRFLLVLLAAIVLNQPEWIELYRPDEMPTIAVLWDDSGSMDTNDVVAKNSTAPPISRREAIAPLTSESTWHDLAERFKVIVQPFSSAQAGHGTNLHDPLAEAPEKFKNLVGVVLASDGDWNEGQPPAAAAGQLRLQRHASVRRAGRQPRRGCPMSSY